MGSGANIFGLSQAEHLGIYEGHQKTVKLENLTGKTMRGFVGLSKEPYKKWETFEGLWNGGEWHDVHFINLYLW